jgi:hypothetical protein
MFPPHDPTATRVTHERQRVANQGDATALVTTVLESLSALSHVIGEETQLVKDGRLQDALQRETRKSELAGAYMRGLEIVKSNAVALARFAPEGVQRLKASHLTFLDLVETNQAVLATARSISESIVRELAREAGRSAQAAGYGPDRNRVAPLAKPGSGPLVVSRSL